MIGRIRTQTSEASQVLVDWMEHRTGIVTMLEHFLAGRATPIKRGEGAAGRMATILAPVQPGKTFSPNPPC